MFRRNPTKRRLAGVATLAVAAALTVAGCASASSSSVPTATTTLNAANRAALANPNLDLGTSLSNKPAPDIKLVNQFGQPMSLSQFRGKVVVLAFIDSQCTTVCPLTTTAMETAKELLGKAGNSVQLLGVDANPKATKVANVLAYSRAHGMVNRWDFLTGTPAQLKKVWKSYRIAVEIQHGLIDHTPALYVIDSRGRLQKIYLTPMAYSSVSQTAQVIATEVATLLPSHPKLSSVESLAAIPPQTPKSTVSLPVAHPTGWTGSNATAVTLGPGKPRLLVFFATWLAETSNLKAKLAGLNSYVKVAASKHLPALTAVDETVTEPSKQAVLSYLSTLGRLDYTVAMDETGRVADGYNVQDQPWLTLVNAQGKITWSHDGWVSLSTLERAAAAHP